MKLKITALLLNLLIFLFIPFLIDGETLTEEQMTAYRTQPAVVLIYSGMMEKVALENNEQYTIPFYGSGTGFFINPEGYLVTNGHVVDIYKKYMDDKDGYSQQILQNFFTNKIITEFKQSNGREPTAREIQREFDRFIKDQQPQIIEHAAINYVLLSNNETHRFEIKKFSPSIPEGGKDIAILKIERDNCPIIFLGDSSKLTLQQPVFTIGFPAVVDPQRFPLLGKENTLKSSITRGAISALKTDYKGMSVIQHDSATSPGNSGGPTVDAKGNVIGVHSYAAREYDGFKFCVPVNTAKEFIRDAGVEINKPSEFTDVFNNLMTAVWKGKWFEARNHVNVALAYMEGEPNLKVLQKEILKRINAMNFFEKKWNQNPTLIIIAIVLIFLILIVIIVVLVKIFSGSSKKEGSLHEKELEFQESEPSEPEAIISTPESPGPAHPKEAPSVKDELTVVENEPAGTLAVIVKEQEIGSYDISDSPVIVGRDPRSATVVIKSEIVSKNHLKIIPKGQQFLIVDMGSTNGTYVNGEKITEILINPKDVVQLGKRGNVKLIFNK